MCAALSPNSPDSFINSSESSPSDHSANDGKSHLHGNDSKLTQPSFILSFETELNKVDEYFRDKASDVRQAILNSLQSMYHQNEWHDNPLTIICRDLDIHVPSNEELIELKATRDALKAEFDTLRQSIKK